VRKSVVLSDAEHPIDGVLPSESPSPAPKRGRKAKEDSDFEVRVLAVVFVCSRACRC
jgi:hypothetical protein